MLMGALAVFTLVAAMGVGMVCDVWRGRAVEPVYPLVHAGAALFGAVLVIAAAVKGDTRLYTNIGLAVVIIALGVLMGFYSKNGKRVPRAVIVAHAGLAVVCYGVLALFAMKPHAVLWP